MMQRALVVAAMGLPACAPHVEPAKMGQRAPHPQTRAPVSATAQPAPNQTPLPEPTAAPAEAAAAKPSEPSLRDVCFAMCDQVKAKCPQSSFEACRLNCGKYDPPAKGCETVVRAALSCARGADDLVCANVAPESCAKLFRHISACASGQKPVEETAALGAGLPAGFSRYQDSHDGLSAPMPDGVVAGQGEGEGNVIARAKHAEGAVYSIRKLPRPVGKLNEKVFLKLGLSLLGRCGDQMKLRGMIDKPGRTSINYSVKCEGGEEQGLFWATDRSLFIATVKGQTGKLGPSEAFLYGFEVK